MDAPGRSRRRDMLATALSLAPAWSAFAQAPTVSPAPAAVLADPTPDDLVRLQLGEDGERRMHVMARVDGRGPFPFMLDTGADHSVLSRELAQSLDLRASGSIRVTGLAGSVLSPAAAVGRLEVGGRRFDDLRMALLPRADLGALGFIGLDCLEKQAVLIDFGAREMQVRRSRGFAEDPGAIVVRGKARFGRLFLVDSTVRRTPIFVVLDSGAQDTMGNPALRALLDQRRRRAGAPDSVRAVTLLSVTGQTAVGEEDRLPELTLGGVRMAEVTVIYADLPLFARYGLAEEPAILLGMDVLRSFARIGIDFARREVVFTLPRASRALA